MTLLVFGLNHNTAELALREKMAVAGEQLNAVLRAGIDDLGLEQIVVLSTCNRTEFYTACNDQALVEDSKKALETWFSQRLGVELSAVNSLCYCYDDDVALGHLMRVSSGLDSMVLGEPQILGQMKAAFAQALQLKTTRSELNRVFEHVFAVAKKIRTVTAVGSNPVSVASAAVRLSRHVFTDLSRNRALLIGAGETIELAARHLRRENIASMAIANRTLEHAAVLAQEVGGHAVLLPDIPQQLEQADIVITSTASQLPLIGKGMVEKAMKIRRNRPIFMVDIAVPRDIEEQVGELDNVYLYTIDDMRDVVAENRRERETEAVKADEIIIQAVNEFNRQRRALSAVDSVRAYRQTAEQLRDAEISRAIAQLGKGRSAEEVVRSLANGLTNKLIHTPSVAMKKASELAEEEKLLWARQLLGINVSAGSEDSQDVEYKRSSENEG